MTQFSSWIGAGGGMERTEGSSRGAFDLRAGGSVTFALEHKGIMRAGPTVELSAMPRPGVWAQFIGGEVSLGELPRLLWFDPFGTDPERFSSHNMEGFLALRVGVGLALSRSLPVLATVTLTYGGRTKGEVSNGENSFGYCHGPVEEIIHGRTVARGVSGDRFNPDYAHGVRGFISAMTTGRPPGSWWQAWRLSR